jgi:peptidoglycan/xylan/chitin deacetylase (PgdA/CDA1 family)
LSGAIPILLYHSISRDASVKFRPWAVSPETFDAHMRHLREEGYRSLTVTQYARAVSTGGPLPERPVIVTFDDGFADFHETALPVMQRHAIACTLYISTGFIGQTSRWLERQGEGSRPMLTWTQVLAVAESGVECGGHTVSHPQLDTLPADRAREEIALSKLALETRLGRPVETFAYPHGYHGRTVRSLVQEAGFTSACAVKNSMSSPCDDLFGLARIIVFRHADMATFDGLLRGQGLKTAPLSEGLKTRGWRVARRTAARLRATSQPGSHGAADSEAARG